MATWDDVRRIALGLPETSEEVSWGHEIPAKDLEEVIVEAWLCRAPKRLAQDYLDQMR
jgi:hypothetical protein